METSVQRDGFVNTLLAAAVLMEEGTDCLAQLVKRASLYLFFPIEVLKANETISYLMLFFWK